MEKELKKFQELLFELFQFDTSDLDFGIYRILNFKRSQIENFIYKELPKKVEDAFQDYSKYLKKELLKELDELKETVIQQLGKDAINDEGKLNEKFTNTPIGIKYNNLLTRKETFEKVDEIKSQVFNDLYNFFSRYYEEGDFVPQYRYSIKNHKYAIPYNGEEVKLYWVNSDQYYIKTGYLFRDYAFKINNYRFVFRTIEASEELGSNKATKERFFVLNPEKQFEINNNTIIIFFEYRELTEKEIEDFYIEGGSNFSKQEKINQTIYDKLQKLITDISIKNALLEKVNGDKPLFLKNLNRFTAKNTKDYFIHKNLKGFLTNQLDYFIKAEVLSIDTIFEEKFFDKHITRAKIVREIGEIIIDFLSQIEDFQKRLWEKKKFVLQTEYVITLDKIYEYTDEKFTDYVIKQALKNKKQLNEWKELGFGEIKNEADLVVSNDMFKKNYKKLPIDTQYFNQNFKEILIENLSKKNDIDEILNGLLIKSENWQALNLILNKYKEKVQTIYIDPPYNTGNDGFLYRDNIQHSSWISMMENRIYLALKLLKRDGSIFISIDDNEIENLIKLLKKHFNFVIPLHWRRNKTPQLASNTVAKRMEFILYATWEAIKLIRERQSRIKPFFNFDGRELRTYELPENIRVEKFDLRKGIVYAKKNKNNWIEILDEPIIVNGYLKNKIRVKGPWRKINDELKKVFDKKLLYINSSGFPIEIISDEDMQIPVVLSNELIIENCYNETAFEELTVQIFNFESKFIESLRPKPTLLIENLLKSLSNLKFDSYIVDFFAGSGTTAQAILKLNYTDSVKRKFILIEMGDFFYKIIIPRIKKVFYSFNWLNNHPIDTKGIGGFFKYQILEQYEDTLDNLELEENKELSELFKDEFLIKYFLDFETRNSPYFLNIKQLLTPFNYKLKVNLTEVGEPQEKIIDIPETFNYLLGINVKKIKFRLNGRKYQFILGDKEGQNVVIVWRDYSDDWNEKDYLQDKDFIMKEIEEWQPTIIYVNGQSTLTDKNGMYEIRYIEPEFKRLMEG